MSVDARITTVKDWQYVSEGGATIVFSYVGASSPDLSGMVIRLRKAPLSELEGISPPIDSASEDREYGSELDDPTIAFQSRVTARLVPPEHLPRLLPCRVSYELLTSLSRASASIRPADRVLKDSIDTRKRRAVLATDLVGFEAPTNDNAGGSLHPRSFAVEIKPKWAFLPNPHYLSPELRDVKTRYGRFVMHTHYRTLSASAGTVDPEAASTYDPLDLFSAEEPRVRTAVQSLWDSWIGSSGAANNLKIFVGGKTVSPAPSLQTSTFHSMAPLLLQEERSTEGLSLADLREPFIESLTNLLIQYPLLSLLAKLQSSLDSLDIEGLDAHWRRYHLSSNPAAEVPMLGRGESEPTLEEWEAFVSEYQSNQKNSTNPPFQSSAEDRIMSREEMRYHILAYLMSATFKDCSIILRLPSASAPDSATPVAASITAIDLDPKSVKRLEKWKQLDRAIALAYSKYQRNLSATSQ